MAVSGEFGDDRNCRVFGKPHAVIRPTGILKVIIIKFSNLYWVIL
jgi:hypothetical protein